MFIDQYGAKGTASRENPPRHYDGCHWREGFSVIEGWRYFQSFGILPLLVTLAPVKQSVIVHDPPPLLNNHSLGAVPGVAALCPTLLKQFLKFMFLPVKKSG